MSDEQMVGQLSELSLGVPRVVYLRCRFDLVSKLESHIR